MERYERITTPVRAYLWARFAVLLALAIFFAYFLVNFPQWRVTVLNLYLISFVYLLSNLVLLRIGKDFEYLLLQLLSDVLIVSYLYWLYGLTSIPFSIFYLFPLFVGGLILSWAQFMPLLLLTVVLFVVLSLHASQLVIALSLFSFLLISLTSFILRRDINQVEKERMKAERWKGLYQKVVDYIPSGVVVFEKGGRIRIANPGARKVLGRDLEGSNVVELSSYPPKFLVRECYTRREGELRDSSGRAIPIGYTVVPFEDDLYLMIFADMGEVKRLEEEQRRSRLLAILGRMSADLAHDIKNPLSAIRGAAEVLEEMDFEDEEVRELVRIIVQDSERLDNLASDFLLFAKPTHGPKDRERVDIYSIVSEICKRPKYKERVEMGGEGPLPVMGYPSQLERVFLNLLDNAIEADSSGKKVGVYCKREGQWVKVGIRDHGPGIPEELKEEAFRPFFSTKEGGIGLGLSISQRIVQAHRGKIFIESPSDGEGTLVVVMLHFVKEQGANERL